MYLSALFQTTLILFTTLTAASPAPQVIDPPCEPTKQDSRTYGAFTLRVSNAIYPTIDNRALGFFSKEVGRDRHLYLLGLPTFYNATSIYTPTLTLQDGNLLSVDPLTASTTPTELVISNQTPVDGTKKLFFTERLGNYRAIFDVYGGCEAGKLELRLMPGGDEDGGPAPYGGTVCVKPVHDRRWELRHVPVGSGIDLGDCVPVNLVAELLGASAPA